MGTEWDLVTDQWGFGKELIINLGPCWRGVKKAEFDLKIHKQVEEYLKKKGFTKSTFLAVSKTLFDPQGLLQKIAIYLFRVRLHYRVQLAN